jgi:hypothetical protein
MPRKTNVRVAGSMHRCHAPIGRRGDRGSFPANLRAGNSSRTFGLLCDVARGVK